MDQAIIDAIADDLARLAIALRTKQVGNDGAIVAAATPEIARYEIERTRYPAEKI